MDTDPDRAKRRATLYPWLVSFAAFILCCSWFSRITQDGRSLSWWHWALFIAIAALHLVATWRRWKSGEYIRRKYAWPKPTAKI